MMFFSVIFNSSSASPTSLTCSQSPSPAVLLSTFHMPVIHLWMSESLRWAIAVISNWFLFSYSCCHSSSGLIIVRVAPSIHEQLSLCQFHDKPLHVPAQALSHLISRSYWSMFCPRIASAPLAYLFMNIFS